MTFLKIGVPHLFFLVGGHPPKTDETKENNKRAGGE